MLVEIYTQIPQSGSVTERRFDATGNCTWVRFAAADADEWTGVFGNGDIVRHSKAVLFGDNRTAFVIAAGQGYIVDAVTGEMLHKTPEDCFCDAISVPGRDFIIACDFTDLYAVSQSGVIWRSERIALDGIKFGSSTDQSLTGECWCGATNSKGADEWGRFILHFDGWRIEHMTRAKWGR
ncbi:MAG: hypothetical protein KDA54_09350 [Phycisphaerales bacterium]|nr:hypothetical protein [Phycisphaerales bacterium]